MDPHAVRKFLLRNAEATPQASHGVAKLLQ